MPDTKISEAPQAVAANLTDRVPVSQGTTSALTLTLQKVRDLFASYFSTIYAPALTADENYVTDAQVAALHGVNDVNSSSATAVHTHTGGTLENTLTDGEYGALHGVNDVNSSSATAAQGALADSALQPGDQVVVGTVSTFYLDAGTTIADNQFLSPSPSTYPQEADSVAVASGTNGGIGFLERFVSGPLGVTSIPAGTWKFHNYCYASNLVGNNKIITRINRRVEQTGMTGTFTGAGATRTFTVTGGTPFVAGDANASILLASLIETPTQTAWISGFTSSSVVTVTVTDVGFVNTVGVPLNALYYLIFNTEAETLDITSSSATTPMHADFDVVRATPTAVNPTDRLLAAYFAYTDQVSSRTIYLLHGGSANYSRIDTPLLGNLITQTITNGATTTAPSEDAVFDALALKQTAVTPGTSGNVLTSNGTAWTSAAPSGGGIIGSRIGIVTATGLVSTLSLSGLSLPLDVTKRYFIRGELKYVGGFSGVLFYSNGAYSGGAAGFHGVGRAMNATQAISYGTNAARFCSLSNSVYSGIFESVLVWDGSYWTAVTNWRLVSGVGLVTNTTWTSLVQNTTLTSIGIAPDGTNIGAGSYLELLNYTGGF